jgi:hypothetical protein
LSSGTRLGYNGTFGSGSGFDAGSESWAVTDINGDGKPDLVITAQASSSKNIEFGATSNA